MNISNNSENHSAQLAELTREVMYLRRIAEQTMGRLFLADTQAIAIREELEQKRNGFKLMAGIAISYKHEEEEEDYKSVLFSISRRINAALNMQRTVIITPDDEGLFSASVLQGYPTEEAEIIAAQKIEVPAELLDPTTPVLITSADPASRLASFRKTLALPYLISSPVILYSNVVALLVTGRLVEELPFFPQLRGSDVETIQTVSTYLAAMLARYRLRQAETLANYDPLTQLFNLRSVTDRIRHTLTRARLGEHIFATLFIDLDGFKVVNDNFGHAVGDSVLRIVAERLKGCVRESDIVGRIGGDEFIVILTHIKHRENAALIAEKIIERLSESIETDGVNCHIGASIGIAIFPEHGTDETALLAAADHAMYAVKNRGKNGYSYAER
jgi:diguanylate cyclase (GGDEF)-like protein